MSRKRKTRSEVVEELETQENQEAAPQEEPTPFPETARVRFTCYTSVGPRLYSPGEVVTLPYSQALARVKRGEGTLVD